MKTTERYGHGWYDWRGVYGGDWSGIFNEVFAYLAVAQEKAQEKAEQKPPRAEDVKPL